jgi:hypothetical protein
MPAHSRPKDGVASLAYVAGIQVFLECRKQAVDGRAFAPPKVIWQGLLKEATAPQAGQARP